MNRALRAGSTIAAALAAAIVLVGPVAAHSGEWGLFLDTAQSSPGASLHLRGDLPSTGPIQIVLVGAQGDGAVLATVDDAPNGHFDAFVTFPADAAPGVWAVEARAAGMQPARASVQLLAGQPADPEEAGSVVAAASAPLVAVSPLAPLPSGPSAAGGVDVVPFVAAALAIVALGSLLLRTRRSTATR